MLSCLSSFKIFRTLKQRFLANRQTKYNIHFEKSPNILFCVQLLNDIQQHMNNMNTYQIFFILTFTLLQLFFLKPIAISKIIILWLFQGTFRLIYRRIRKRKIYMAVAVICLVTLSFIVERWCTKSSTNKWLK